MLYETTPGKRLKIVVNVDNNFGEKVKINYEASHAC